MEVHGKTRTSPTKAPPSKTETFCQPCHDGGTPVAAVTFCQDCQDYLCRDCSEHHRRLKAVKHHVLLDTTPASTPASPSLDNHGNKTSLTCPTHSDKAIEFYCQTHNSAVCGICAVLDH